MSRVVIDSWPFNNEVGKLLVELEEDFNSLTRKNIKMSKLKILNETPLDFQEKNIFDKWKVSYLDLMEVNQGSPLVGSLSINGQVIIKEQGFGGPLLYFNRKIYIPVFIRRFCVVGFRLATLNLDDLSIEYIGGIEDLVYLKEIKGNRIYFYTDIYKSTEKNLTLYEQKEIIMDMTLFNFQTFWEANSDEDYRENTIRMSIALMTFLKKNGLLVDIEPFNEDGSIKEDLIIRKSNVTDEGFQLFVKPVNNWWNALDRGTPPEKVTILENGLKKIRAAKK